MRRFTWLLLLLIPLTVHAIPNAQLLGLDIRPASDVSTFIFTLDRSTSGKVAYYNNQQQVVLDFENATNKFKLKHAWLGEANVKTIETMQIKPHTIRFVFPVRTVVKYKMGYQKNIKHGVNFELKIITVPQQTNALRAAFHRDLANVDKEALLSSKNKKHQFTIVIDAGHGGSDPGAIGPSGLLEKNVVLKIAKKLANEINEEPNMKAILTRSGDYFLPLRKRLNIARKSKADLFIAIHADAHYDKEAEGISVFALSKHGATSEAARWLAQRENYSELNDLELNSLQDHSIALRSTLIDLAQTVTIEDSLRLGRLVLQSLDDISTLHYKTVEQAPFVVLKSPDVPSILVETGFITNPHEERRLNGEAYQHQIVYALQQGIAQYLKQVAAE